MAEQLKNILAFTVDPSQTVVIPHKLQTSLGVPLTPDIIFAPVPSLEITADDENITIFNDGPEPATGAMLVESWHTIERAFGDKAITDLSPKPYIVTFDPVPAQPPFNLSQVTIYARLTGSDTTGNGTLAKPYRTFQRAIRDVPSLVPPGVQYYVDCTGIGPEVLPPNYALPAWKAPYGFRPDFSAEFFLPQTAVNMRATPRLVASLGAKATISAGEIVSFTNRDISGQLIIKTTKTYVTDELVGKIIHGAGGFFETGVVYHNTVDTIFTTNNFVSSMTAPIQIMEQSAELITTQLPNSEFVGGLSVANIDSCAIQGFNIHPATPGFGEISLNQYGGTCWINGCNLVAPNFSHPARDANMDTTNLDGDGSVTFWEFGVQAPIIGCRIFNCQADPNGTLFNSVGTGITNGTVIDSCGPVSAFGVPDMYLDHILIRNAVGAGIRFQSGFLEPFYVAFENCQGHAIDIRGGEAILYGQMGAVGGGGWVGEALVVSGGANVALQPFGTDVAFDQVGDSMKVGTLTTRTFADFRVPATGGFVQQMLDVTAFNLASPTDFGAAGTGSRVNELPPI